MVGSPAYSPPEAAVSDAPVDGRYDQYSLATVVFEVLAGFLPFPGGSPTMQLVLKHRESPPPLSKVVRDVPPALSAAVDRALARTPSARFPACSAFAKAALH